MSRHGDAASTTGSSVSGAGGGRWDAERFMREHRERREPSTRRERRTAVEVVERDRVEKNGRSFVEEYLHAQETYGPPARQADRVYEDEHLISSTDALIPYKERRRASPSPFRKPKLLRRQSSLDTFDRAATRLASEYYDRDDYGPPVVPVTAPRRRSPPSESDLESIRVAEPDYYGDEVFRSMRERDRSVTPRGRYSLREEIVKEKSERPYPRRGKTRVPKNLVHPRAIIDLGYPFEDEGDSIIILQALGKDNIDELVNFSREIRRNARAEEIREKERLVARPRSESVSVRSHARRRSPSVLRPRAELVEYRETRGTRRISPSPAPSPAPTMRSRRRRLSSPIRVIQPHESLAEQIIQPNTDVALILPDRTRRSDREIRAEILALEEERRLVADRELLAPGDAIEIKKNYKAPNPRLIRAMMATLT